MRNVKDLQAKIALLEWENSLACAFAIGDGVSVEACIQPDGSTLWAVRRQGECLSSDGGWEHEPSPSNRDDAFISRCRYSKEAAFKAAFHEKQQMAEVERYIVISKAIVVIGDEEKAILWLQTPVRGLDYDTPFSRLLGDQQSRADVMRLLAQLAHGVL